MLEPDFEGRDELRVQSRSATAKQILEDGTMRLECDKVTPAPGQYRVPMEATGMGSDGLPINVLLHIDRDGFLAMLKIIYYGGSGNEGNEPPPCAEDLTLVPPIPGKRARASGASHNEELLHRARNPVSPSRNCAEVSPRFLSGRSAG